MESVHDFKSKKTLRLNQSQNEDFGHSLEFGSRAFLEMAYNDSLRQFPTSSREKKTMKKILGANFWPNGPKSGPKIGFSPFSQVWFISFPLNCIE